MKVLDLFCGMGGLSLGFALALEEVKITGLDIDKFAVETYNLNLNGLGCEAIRTDVLEWEPSEEYDMVIGGPPCQPFSTANTKHRGKEHRLFPTFPRFFDLILRLRPKVFLMENVKGLVSKAHVDLFREQLSRLVGYKVGFKVLNAAYFGVPQRRERVFVMGIRKDLGVEPSFPRETHGPSEVMRLAGGRVFRWVTVGEAIGDLLSITPEGLVLPDSVVERIRVEREDTSRHFGRMEFPDSLDKPSRTISSHTVEGSKRETIVVPITEHVITSRGGWDNPKSDWGSRVMSLEKPAFTITEKHRSGQLVPVTEHEVRYYDMEFSKDSLRKHPPQDIGKPSSTIRASFHKVPPDATVRVGGRYRRLSVRECLRLQSFPDWWSFPEGVSVSRKYKLVGEAVCPILAYRLAIHIGKLMGWKVKEPPKYEEWHLPYFNRAFADYFYSD